MTVWLLAIRIVTADGQIEWISPSVEFPTALACFAVPLELGPNVIQVNRLCVRKEDLEKR